MTMFSESFSFFLSTLFGSPIITAIKLSGGCIHNCLRIKTQDKQNYFLKYSSDAPHDMFSKEVDGLITIGNASQSFRVPNVIDYGFHAESNYYYLILEYIDCVFPNKYHWKNLGSALAELHGVKSSFFGYRINNYIGNLSQKNDGSHKDWLCFFCTNRLSPVISAIKRKYKNSDSYSFLDDIIPIVMKHGKNLFPSCRPSLLHGDLWRGNILFDAEKKPILIDPAVYYGHPEMEIAFTYLFDNGFNSIFRQSYERKEPLEKGFERRMNVYLLYPLLVHFYHFGVSYASPIQGIIKKLI